MIRIALVGALSLAGCYAARMPEPLSLASLRGWPAAAPASAPGDGPLVLDVDAAIALALRDGPTLAEGRAREEVAEAQIRVARQLADPELRVGRSSDVGMLGDIDRIAVGVRVHPDMPSVISARGAQATAAYEAERAVTAGDARTLVTQVRRAYIDLAFADSSDELLARELDVMKRRRAILAEQMGRNLATRLELALADAEVVEAESSRSAVELAAKRTRSTLALLLGLPAERAWRPVSNRAAFEGVKLRFDRDQLLQQALVDRPDLAEAAMRARAADAKIYEEKARRIPWVDFVQLERSFRTDGGTDEWAISAGITLPIFSWAGGRVAAAEAEKRRHVTARRTLATSVVRQITDAIEVAESSGKRVRALQQSLEPLDREIAELLGDTRPASDPIKLLLLEGRHLRTHRAVLDALREHQLAVIAVDALVGAHP